MYLTKLVATVTTTGSTDTTGYSSGVANGTIYSIQHVPGDLNSTGIVSVYPENSTEVAILSGVSLTTDNWTYYPRVAIHDSTVATTSWENDTGARKQTAGYALSNERVKLITEDSSTSIETGTFNILVEG